MLADTPPTFLLWLLLAVSAIGSPAVVVWSVVLAIRRASRRFGLSVMASAVIGSIFCALAWTSLSTFVHEPVSTVGTSMWLFLVAGGFGSFGAVALVAGYAFGVFHSRGV